MELIRISDNKIKIMLSALDMDTYDLPRDGIEGSREQAREAFRSILAEANRLTGFDPGDNRLSIQYYPSRAGGCEMFITRTGEAREHLSGGDDRYGEEPSYLSSRQRIGGAMLREVPSTRPCEKERGRHEAYGFDRIEWMLCVCRRLRAEGYSGESRAFVGENQRSYLFLSDTGGNKRAFITEYGSPENAEEISLYVSEHGKPLCASDAVEILGGL